MTTVFVAGATGYTGREVVRASVDASLRTIAHVRPDSPKLEAWRERFRSQSAEVDTTPWEEGALARRLAELAPQVVFALLGTTRVRARRAKRSGGAAENYETVDFGLTAMLLRAVQRMQRPARFVYLSAAGAGRASMNPYYAARNEMERELRASGVPWTIARPSFITGSDRDEPRPLERLGVAAADAGLGFIAALGARRSFERYRSTSNVELAGALVRCALEPQAEGRVIESEGLRR